MRIRYSLLFLLTLLLSLGTHAQAVKLTASSKRSWSGGIAGRYGASYNFTVEFSDYKKYEPVPDTLWIGNKCIPVILKADPVPKNYNTTRTSTKKKVSFAFAAGTDHRDDPRYADPYGNDKKKAEMPTPPVKYSGVALLSYRYKGKQKYFVIDKIITNYPPVNYP